MQFPCVFFEIISYLRANILFLTSKHVQMPSWKNAKELYVCMVLKTKTTIQVKTFYLRFGMLRNKMLDEKAVLLSIALFFLFV
jgi:hypothetical protein